MAQKRKRRLTADKKQASRGPTQKSHKKGKPRNVHGEWLPQTRTEIKAAHQIKTEKEERKRLKKSTEVTRQMNQGSRQVRGKSGKLQYVQAQQGLRKKYQDEDDFNIVMDGLKEQDARHLQFIRRVVIEYAQPCYSAHICIY
jgi:hypothetical protein